MGTFWTWTAAVFAATASPALAQDGDGFDLSGSVRLRYEAIANQPRVGYNRDDALVNLRTTVMARYRSGPFTVAGEIWDSRVYGNNPGSPVTTGEVDTLEPVQAFVAWKGGVGKAKISAQAGRFLLNIGSRRLVGADEYRNTTNGYTGLRGDVLADRLTATVIYVLPQQRRPDDAASLQSNAVALDREGFDLVLWGATIARAKSGVR
jgi:hypothetical protein